MRYPTPPPNLDNLDLGGEIGSTDRDRQEENCRMTPLLVKTINANDNFAPQDFAIAA